MPMFSQAFGLEKTQAELDFVDVLLHTDMPLFIDPFALSQRADRWSQECHASLVGFFQLVVDSIRRRRDQDARQLLSYLREPNETRLGLSARRPQGTGIGRFQAGQIFDALQDSAAVQTGFLSSLEECELMIDGIARDKISDLTTNVIRAHLVEYTLEQCKLHGLPVESVPLAARFDRNSLEWVSGYVELPTYRRRPILLVPKFFVRYDPAYEHRRYYRHFVLEFLRSEAIEAGSSLVRTLKNGRQVVYKKDLEQRYPCTKQFLYEFSRDHPEVLQAYRESLARLEAADRASDVDPKDEPAIAQMLARSLGSIEPGAGRASDYHRLMVGVVEFVVFPQLLYPRKEREIHEGRKRIDIVMENGARRGIFDILPRIRQLPCAYVMFECKNYTTEIGNPDLDQLAGRFSVQRGKLGFLCCRRFEDRSLFIERCRDTFGDDRGLILALEDDTVLGFLELIENGRRESVDERLRELVAEVWLA